MNFKDKLYQSLIFLIIILKVFYFAVTLCSKIMNYTNIDDKYKNFFEKLSENSLTVTDFFMYLVLVILFSPLRHKHVDIVIKKEEQMLIWTLGILGLIHMNWLHFEAFFNNIKLIIKRI